MPDDFPEMRRLKADSQAAMAAALDLQREVRQSIERIRRLESVLLAARRVLAVIPRSYDATWPELAALRVSVEDADA